MKYQVVDIYNMLPHRWPFLLVDKIVECVPGKSAVGIKNVTIDEPFFAGHFPSEPIFPGVLIVEVIAQTAAVMYCAEALEKMKIDTQIDSFKSEDLALLIKSQVGYLVEIKTMKFISPIVPGDTMRVEVKMKGTFGLLSLIESKVFVDNKVVVEGKIAVSKRVVD